MPASDEVKALKAEVRRLQAALKAHEHTLDCMVQVQLSDHRLSFMLAEMLRESKPSADAYERGRQSVLDEQKALADKIVAELEAEPKRQVIGSVYQDEYGNLFLEKDGTTCELTTVGVAVSSGRIRLVGDVLVDGDPSLADTVRTLMRDWGWTEGEPGRAGALWRCPRCDKQVAVLHEFTGYEDEGFKALVKRLSAHGEGPEIEINTVIAEANPMAWTP